MTSPRVPALAVALLLVSACTSTGGTTPAASTPGTSTPGTSTPGTSSSSAPSPASSAPRSSTPEASPTAPSESPSASTPAGPPRLTFDGFGPIRLGMTLEELKAGRYAAQDPYCSSGVGPSKTVDQMGITYLYFGGRVTMVKAVAKDVKTPEGAHVGMNWMDTAALYGEGWKRLEKGELASTNTYYVQKGDRSMIFHLYAGTVESIQVHDMPAEEVPLMGC